ncbi:oligoribonuclease [Nesterenkonia sp. AN1]|uniref:Oligoribonuclease n=1 Tax=Nesterenkonia aurantiaca TaxID=1436010 RepID=A0A4R7G0Z6_9MICC|nr:oligoribonuclease [Nesterenkonia sp. AN1]TDS84728.1 oligoribonuclease [Nesterenkonia aurantiaca]
MTSQETETNASSATTVPVTPGGSWAGRMVWIDCEMTGLNPDHDVLVEIAALVTDAELNVLGEGVQVVIAPDPAERLKTMEPIVQKMHTESGLLEDLKHGVSVQFAEQKVLDYVKAWIPEAGVAPLAGNSIHADKAFLRVAMPELMKHLHYRLIDVSTIKELSSRWYPEAKKAAPAKTGNHRALGDIQDSIEELRHYRRTVFKQN